MTRRKFIRKLIKTGAAVITGTWCLAKKAVPRKFIRAVKLNKYPGSLVSLRDINKENKWSG